MPDRPVAAVLAVVRRDVRLLMARRRLPPDQGLWGFPGGRIESGETIAQAALRELLEETGVEAEADLLLPPLELIRTPPEEPGRPIHIILCPVLCRWRRGEGRAADGELEDVTWLSLNGILALDPAATSRDVLPLARQALAVTPDAMGRPGTVG